MTLKRLNTGGAGQAPPSNKPAILYVEDEDPNWHVAAVTLGRSYTMHRARTSEEAFQELLAREYRAILMDIQLSGSEFNGIQITRILTNKYPGVPPEVAKPLIGKCPPIIFVSAYTARYKREDLIAIGGEDLIAKPIDFLQLSNAITRVLLRSIK